MKALARTGFRELESSKAAMMRAQALPPVEEASPAYTLKSLSAPVLSGFALRTFISLMESTGGYLVAPVLLWNSGVTHVRAGPARSWLRWVPGGSGGSR